MDPLQINVLMNSNKPAAISEDAFYEQHSLSWMHRLRQALRTLRSTPIQRLRKRHDRPQTIQAPHL